MQFAQRILQPETCADLFFFKLQHFIQNLIMLHYVLSFLYEKPRKVYFPNLVIICIQINTMNTQDDTKICVLMRLHKRYIVNSMERKCFVLQTIMKLCMTGQGGDKKAGVMIPIPQYPLYTATIAEYNAFPVSTGQRRGTGRGIMSMSLYWLQKEEHGEGDKGTEVHIALIFIRKNENLGNNAK